MAKKVREASLDLDDLIGAVTKGVKGAKTFDTEGLFCDIPYWIDTKSTVLNFAISGDINCGVPAGRLVEIFGEESSGKTTVATNMLIGCQEAGGIAIVFDTETAKNKERDTSQGLDPKRLIYMEQEDGEVWTMEDVFQKMDEMIVFIRSKNPDIPVAILWDSVAATTSEAEEIADYDANVAMASHARTISKAMRKLMGKIGKYKVLAIFINQVRDKVNVKFGSKHETFGGKAIKFYASVRLQVSRIEVLEREEKIQGRKGTRKIPYGIRQRIKTIKNKVSAPFNDVEIDILFSGEDVVDDIGSVLDYLADTGKIERNSKGLLTINGVGMWRKVARKYVKENPRVWKSLKALIMKDNEPDESEDA